MNTEAEIAYQEGQSLAADGRELEAFAAYRRAVARDPGHARAWTDIGVILAEAGRMEEAERAFRNAVAADATLAPAEKNLGVLLWRTGREEEAEFRLRRALALDATAVDIVRDTGEFLMQKRSPGEAKQILAWAVALVPTDPANWFLLSTACFLDDDLDYAQHAINRALKLRPAFPQALNNLGMILEERGDRRGARDAWRRALVVDPDLKEARANLAEFPETWNGNG